MYFDGRAMALDYAAAYVWFALAARQTPLVDNRKALTELQNIAAVRMSSAELEDAVRRVESWTATPWP